MISKIIALLSALVAALQGLARRKEHREAQDERDRLEGDPADWYNEHFGGVRRDDADKADQADIDRRGE